MIPSLTLPIHIRKYEIEGVDVKWSCISIRDSTILSIQMSMDIEKEDTECCIQFVDQDDVYNKYKDNIDWDRPLIGHIKIGEMEYNVSDYVHLHYNTNRLTLYIKKKGNMLINVKIGCDTPERCCDFP